MGVASVPIPRPEATDGGPAGNFGDLGRILAGTSQNLAGILVAGAATLIAQVLIGRALGVAGFGVVTVVTQAAFVLSFLTRAGMDMAVLRDVAIEVGAGRRERVGARVARAAAIAAAVSAGVAIVVVLAEGAIRSVFSIPESIGGEVVQAAAVGLPFLALANVWLGATRGLKIMRYTLYVFWAGQPLAWIALMLAGWRLAQTPWMTVLAYSLSWAVAAGAAFYCWRRETRGWGRVAMAGGDTGGLVRYAGPRAPAALFAQLLFWTDLFVLTNFVSEHDVGVYSAALRAGQLVVLFLTSVNLMFSPYVAELHSKGATDRLDLLFKTLTRWTVAATLPAFLLLAVAPEGVLEIFGRGFEQGRGALLVLIAGQFVNVLTGSAGFVLIMAGRTGWDLAVYAGSFLLDLALAFALCPPYGVEGAAAANALTFAASNVVRLALVARFVGIQPYDRLYLRLVAPGLVSFGAMSLVHARAGETAFSGLVATALTGGAAYVVAYVALGLSAPERRHVLKLLARLHPR